MATEASGVRPSARVERWSPARWYLVVSGVGLLLIAGTGFALNSSFPTASGAVGESAHIFGVFETNGWHNAAGLASGLLAIALALDARWARFGALLKGGFYVIVTSALFLWEPGTFLIVSNNADQVLHGLLAVGGLAAGLATRPGTKS